MVKLKLGRSAANSTQQIIKPRGNPVIMPINIRDRSIDIARIARIGERKKLELARHRVREGDVLFARRGDAGRFAVVSEQESGWMWNWMSKSAT